jgi:hypothetical protein
LDPASGWQLANQLAAKVAPSIDFSSIEIPRRGLRRYVVFELQLNGKISVIKDFVGPAQPEISRVARLGKGLVYTTLAGAQVAVPHEPRDQFGSATHIASVWVRKEYTRTAACRSTLAINSDKLSDRSGSRRVVR